MIENRNNKEARKEFEAVLTSTEAKIEAIDQRLVKEKLTSSKFLQLYNERGALMVKRRFTLKKLSNVRSGKNPWGEIEKVIV